MTVTGPVGGAVGVVVDVGQTSKRYCASFGGQEQRNDAETIRRRNAPAPGVCPVFTPSTGPTTTTTSTTIIVEDPFVCCAVPGEARCFWMFLGCPDGSVQGEAGSHCDGATGACVTTPPSGGDCCDNTMVPQSCSGGPGAAAQCALPGVLVPNAICYAGSTGCITVTSTTSSSTTSTTAP